MTNNLVSAWVRRYRTANPRSRVVSPYRIHHNGASRRVYESLVDGSRISMCAKYPTTKRVYSWMRLQEQLAAAQVSA